MAPNELEKYLHDHIPISKAMQVSVVDAQRETIVLSAPLAPNINHRETVFGGSSSALAILAGWSLVHFRLRSEGIDCRLVIRRNSMTYERPISGTFTARSSIATEGTWESFKRAILRKGRGRIAVKSILEYSGQCVGYFEGEFVAIAQDSSAR